MSHYDEGRWQDLCTRAREYRVEGEFDKALKLYKKALDITPNHDKLKNIIKKIEDHVDSSSMVHMGDGYYMAQEVFDQLYEYQREGVKFLYNLFTKKTGGILGDDMGLGKTVQVCSFLSGMFDSRRIGNALIVVPPPLISNWEIELTKWTPGLNITKVHECQKREKSKRIDEMKRRGGVCLTSYNTYTTSSDLLGEIAWDCCILDEGHKIKNHHTKTAKSLHGVKCQHRVILTGTPIMNGLKELWSLYDWTHQGQLLGSFKTFTEKFESPIMRARQKDAKKDEIRLGDAMSLRLNEIISPYLLRRLKENIKNQKSADSGAAEMPKLMKKNDLICWIRVSEDQEKVYKGFLTSDEVKQLLNSTKSPLVGLTLLKKICDHPRLLSNQKCKMLGVSEGFDGLNDDSDEETEDQFNISLIPNEVLVQEAGKMKFLFGLLDNLRADKHKCLIFSQSRKILDIIEKVLDEKKYKFLRLDGRVRLMAERQQLIDRFQKNNKYQVFLLTTKVGGVGLTLTAADRVIIYDPSWNPSTDAQAVDRAFRIGQKHDVVVYRLITCGTVEEKIYRRQVYKDSICKKTLQDSKNPFRHFSKQDLFQLFELDNLEESETQLNLAEMFKGKRNSDKNLDAHIQFLHTLDNFSGISDHDLLFSKDASDDDTPHDNRYLEGYVNQAMERLNIEAKENKLLSQQVGHYVGGGALDPKSKDGKKKKELPPSSQSKPTKSSPRRKYAVPSSTEEDNNNGSDKENAAGGDDDDRDEQEDGSEESQNTTQNSSMASHSASSKRPKYIDSSHDEEEEESNDTSTRRSLLRAKRSSTRSGRGSTTPTNDDRGDDRGNTSRKAYFHGNRTKATTSAEEDGDDEGEGEPSKPGPSENNSIEIIPDSDDDDDNDDDNDDDKSRNDTENLSRYDDGSETETKDLQETYGDEDESNDDDEEDEDEDDEEEEEEDDDDDDETRNCDVENMSNSKSRVFREFLDYDDDDADFSFDNSKISLDASVKPEELSRNASKVSDDDDDDDDDKEDNGEEEGRDDTTEIAKSDDESETSDEDEVSDLSQENTTELDSSQDLEESGASSKVPSTNKSKLTPFSRQIENPDADEEEKKDRLYQSLLREGKDYCKAKNYKKSLKKFQQAFSMYPEDDQDDIIPRMIEKLKERIARGD